MKMSNASIQTTIVSIDLKNNPFLIKKNHPYIVHRTPERSLLGKLAFHSINSIVLVKLARTRKAGPKLEVA